MMLTPAELESALCDYTKEIAFTMKIHVSDLNHIDSLDSLVADFDTFFDEFVSVVVASGFRARVAAHSGICCVSRRHNPDAEALQEPAKIECDRTDVATMIRMV
jgi:hypothetical protein